MGDTVAARQLQHAQPVAMRIEPERFAVDSDTVRKREAVRQIALVHENLGRHPLSIGHDLQLSLGTERGYPINRATKQTRARSDKCEAVIRHIERPRNRARSNKQNPAPRLDAVRGDSESGRTSAPARRLSCRACLQGRAADASSRSGQRRLFRRRLDQLGLDLLLVVLALFESSVVFGRLSGSDGKNSNAR